MSGIFNPQIFSTAIFNIGAPGVVTAEVVKTGTGGIDPEDRKKKRYPPYKPTGLLERRAKNIPAVEARTEEIRDIHAEIVQKLSRELDDAAVEFKPIGQMTAAEIDREIGILMREKIQKDDEEETMLIMMMALHD